MSRVKRVLFVLLALDLVAMVGAMAMAAKLPRIAYRLTLGGAVAGLVAAAGVSLALTRRFKSRAMVLEDEPLRVGQAA